MLNINNIPKLLIHLPEREDRLIELDSQKKYFPLENTIIVEGVRKQDPFKGIARAHINCIQLAKSSGWENVLIMEDDLVFQGKDKTAPYFQDCLLNLPEDWDILLGGVYLGTPIKYNEYWSKIGEFCALHFYIVNSKAYDTILTYDFKHHIDRWMNLNNRLKCYVVNRFIATQRNGFSDNVKAKTDYTTKLVKYKLL